MRPIHLAALPVLLSLAAPPASAQPSFACRRASTPVEEAICASPGLSARDSDLSAAFRAAAGVPGVPESQRAWLAERNRRCGIAMPKAAPGEREACLVRLYDDRLAELRRLVPAAAVAPGTDATYGGRWLSRIPGIVGELTLRPRPDGGWDARLRTARENPPNPTCDVDWIARPMTDGSLVGRTEDGTGVTMLLRRDGPLLRVAATDQDQHCGVNATFTGAYGR
ncbi:lysozyme inhibitor LprI family protein [Roseomonas sp. CCTCC AB2023176]|uniref:lysozyme inhibitor LprI family protein n=1 Tax=Roseomonas sp. CCTCC AB2023176 TaxID=3342640 RepID=UPI0035D8478A